MARSGRPSPAVTEAWTSLLEAHRRLVPMLDRDLRQADGLTLEWYDVLFQLNEAGGTLTMGQLGQRLLVGASRCTRRVDRMTEAGLVSRRRDDADARIVHATLTDDGRSTFRRAAVTHLQSIQRHIGRHLDDDQAKVMAAAFQAMAADTDESEAESAATEASVSPEARRRRR